jgi:hypothetical protein
MLGRKPNHPEINMKTLTQMIAVDSLKKRKKEEIG